MVQTGAKSWCKYGDFNMRYFYNKTFSGAVNRLDLEISQSCYVYGDQSWNLTNTVCSSYSRMYFWESGNAKVWVHGKEIELVAGNVYIIPTGLPFTAKCDDKYTKVFFHFAITKPNGYDLFADCTEVLSAEIGAERIQKIKNLFRSENLIDTLTLKNEILTIALSLFPEEKSKDLFSSVYSAPVQRAIDYIKANPSIKLSVKDLSENIFIARTTLSKHFLDEVGVNIGKYIDDIVFEYAKKMLIKTDFPIEEISNKYGFCDRFYFSRRFKEKFGYTPYQYRKMNTTTLS